MNRDNTNDNKKARVSDKIRVEIKNRRASEILPKLDWAQINEIK